MAAALPIFISAGEASGDLYGALLMEGLRARLGAVEFFGCGGDRMRAAGCETLVDARRVAMVGLLEVLPGLLRAWSALRRLKFSIRARRPELAVLIDFPDFNLRLARELKQAGIPVVYFVAPQVWAWRRGRVAALRASVDRLLCIFSFEEKFFQEAGVPALFVGHPLVGRVAPALTAEEFRRRFALPEKLPLIALLPGSRRREVLLNLPPMLATARCMARRGEFGFVLAAASSTTKDWVRSQVAHAGVPVSVVEGHTYDAIAHAAAAVVASGTATIETALLGTPMVVVYRVSALSWWLGRMLVQTPFYSMVNLVAGRSVVPELIQKRFRPEAVAHEVRQLLENPAAREQMQQGLQYVTDKLRMADQRVTTGFPGHSAWNWAEKSADPIQLAVGIMESILQRRLSLAASA